MNEENQRKGPGVFYAVVGVATLVVAIIGATFAYFSASVTPDENSDNIQGETNNISGASLTVTVTKLFGIANGASANSDNLVPAAFRDNNTGDITAALTAQCVDDGYTGCHVYDIMIESDQTIDEADLLLDLAVTPVTGGSKANWKYLVFQGSSSSATSITTAATSLSSDASDVELHERSKPTTTTGLTANTPVHYYLMVYLANIDAAQNDPAATAQGTTTYELGSYQGSVELKAMGGQVKATFTSGT